MNKSNTNKNLEVLNNTLFFLFLIFPISILIGNFAINLVILITSSIFLIVIITQSYDFNDHWKIFYLLNFFFISLLINLIFSNNFYLSYPRVIKFFLIIFFIISFRHIILNFKESKITKIYKIWSIIFLLIIIDLIFEFIIGNNIIGLNSVMPGSRLASFTGKESVIGNFFCGFSLIFLSYCYYKYSKQKFFNFLLAIFLIFISFIIGERSNFIKTFIMISFFIIFIYDIKLKVKGLFALLLLTSFIIIINLNNNYKLRYYNQISEVFEKNGISKFLKKSQYGAHYNVANEIFKDNPLFGVGIKNYRVESGNKKYDNLDHLKNNVRASTHPHQVHYEFLSETGIFGYLCFLIFILTSIYWSIKSYLINKNYYQFASILFVSISIMPLIPSGSFLSTYSSSIFWINYAIMIGYVDIKKKIP